MSEVNFLSFGKREKILKRMHKKYISYIFVFIVILIILFKNIIYNFSEFYESYKPIKYQNMEIESIDHVYSKVDFLINNMKLFIDRIVYNESSLNVYVRVLDKRDIYSFVDKLNNNNLKVLSYSSFHENSDELIYSIEVEV